MDVPEGSLLAVQDLPLDFILFPVNPADEIRQFEKDHVRLFLELALDVAGEAGWDEDKTERYSGDYLSVH